MARTVCEEPKTSRQVSLYLGASGQAAWENVLLPWFESVAPHAFENQEPVAVVAPLGSDSAFLREQLLKHRVSLLGVKFLSPPVLREILLRDSHAKLPLREHLRLLLAIAAEEFSARSGESEQDDVDLATIAKSVTRGPDHLLRAIDQLSAAGWSFEDAGPAALGRIAQKFQELVRQCGFQMIHEADGAAVEAAPIRTPRFSELLVTGFHAAQWPLWPLLHAAVASAKKATVVLSNPREEARVLDEYWIGTWEETFGAAIPIGETADDNVRTASPEKPHFLVGINVTEQACAIVAVAIKFLQEKSCTRLGILFPGAGSLPRLVSSRFGELQIPHHDGVAHLMPGQFEEASWNTWLELQEDHRLDVLLRFLHALPGACDFFGGVPIQKVEETLRKAYQQILIDDIAVLREYCSRQTERRDFAQIAQGVTTLKFLPRKATLTEFLAETKAIFAQLEWKERWSEVEQFARDWSGALRSQFSRSVYLRWLKEILTSFSLARDSYGEQPYSRVHLLSYPEAEGQQWSHLILAGLNQGEWPRGGGEAGFSDEEEIATLNKRAVQQGKQGEGHWTAKEGKTLLLGPQERRQIAARQIASAVESVEGRLAATASLFHESVPERMWNPSEFFNQLYFAARRAPLSQEMMSILRENTRAWLRQEDFLQIHKTKTPDVAQTLTAYNARRRADEQFGEYEFALREPIAREIALRVTQWNKVVKCPAIIWMKAFLGVEDVREEFDQWSTATGEWVHRWLAQISNAPAKNVFVDRPAGREMQRRARNTARRFREEIVDLCSTCGRAIPDWWLSGWSNALALADCLAEKVGETNEWRKMATEWTLDSPQIVSLSPAKDLRFGGRIDLMLARNSANDSAIGHGEVWVVDYKTGNHKALSAASWRTPEARLEGVRKKLVRGDAVQLGLYGLAARQLGAEQVALSLLSPRLDLERPQLDLAELEAHRDFWLELYRMQETGIFGMLGPIRSEFSFTGAYPLATLSINNELLREKWALTHPALADDDTEDRQ
jgi:hypothetical protein